MKLTKMAWLVLSLFSACAANPNPPAATDNTLSDGNNGNFAYYGIFANGGFLEAGSLPTGPGIFALEKAFYLNIIDANARYLDAAIYHPTCLTRNDPAEYYSLVLMSESPAAPTALSLAVRPLSIDYSFQSMEVGAANYLNPAILSDPGDHLPTTCIKGTRTSPGWGTLYSNGELALYIARTGEVYFGLRSTWIPQSVATAPASYSEYFQNQYAGTACGIGTPCANPGLASPAGAWQENSSAYNLINPGLGSAGPARNSIFNGQIFNTELDPRAITSFHVIKAATGETNIRSAFIAADGWVKGRRLLLAAQPLDTDSDTAPSYILGAGAIYLRLAR